MSNRRKRRCEQQEHSVQLSRKRFFLHASNERPTLQYLDCNSESFWQERPCDSKRLSISFYKNTANWGHVRTMMPAMAATKCRRLWTRMIWLQSWKISVPVGLSVFLWDEPHCKRLRSRGFTQYTGGPHVLSTSVTDLLDFFKCFSGLKVSVGSRLLKYYNPATANELAGAGKGLRPRNADMMALLRPEAPAAEIQELRRAMGLIKLSYGEIMHKDEVDERLYQERKTKVRVCPKRRKNVEVRVRPKRRKKVEGRVWQERMEEC